MFTCAKIRDGSTYLSNHLSANDYYCEGEHVAGMWMGKGAEMLGLAGQAIAKNDSAFEALRLNQHPDGSGKLTPRNVENSIRFFDFQCSAQKSVSIMAVTLQDHRLCEAHDLASCEALAELEKFAAVQAGQGNGKRRETTGNLCAAAFRHDASRELDPQLHTHFVVANATCHVESGRWLALETHDMFKAIRYAGKVYQNELACQCRRLGYEIEHVRNEKGAIEGFEIKGVSVETRQRFSKRRAAVEAAIAEFVAQRGRQPTPAEITEMTRETRSFKLKEITTPEVLARQRSQLSSEELRSLEGLRNRALSRVPSEPALLGPEKALLAARQHLFERRSVLAGHEILAEALNQGLGALEKKSLATALNVSENGLLPIGRRTKEALNQPYATPEGLALERWAVGFVNGTKEMFRPLGATQGIPFQFQSDEQRRVVLETLNCPDQVCAIRGVAGAGKTTSLREIARSLEVSGRQVYYLAPTASAAKVLQGDGFGTATTVSDFLTNRIRNEADRLRDAVLIVDEAGLQSNKLGAAVLKVAEKTGSRVLFVGDTRQHVSVEAGDFLRILEAHSRMQVAELRTIRRQLVQEYNLAIREMAAGQTAVGMERLHALGWVQEARNGYLDAAADSFFRETAEGKRLDHTLAVSPTWAENYRLTEAIRSRLKASGVLLEGREMKVHDSLKWTRQQMRQAANYHPGLAVTFNLGASGIDRGESLVVERVVGQQIYFEGRDKPFEPRWHAGKIDVAEQRRLEVSVGDRLLIRRNDRTAGLVNGDVVTVSGVDRDGAIRTREGATLRSDFRDFCHGYVVTSHKAQGRTHTSVVLAAEEVDAKAAYVACSRGRERCSVFTPDLAHFMQRLGRSGDRTAALDLMPPINADPQPTGTHQNGTRLSNLWKSIKENGTTFAHRLHKGLSSSLDHNPAPGPELRTSRSVFEPTLER